MLPNCVVQTNCNLDGVLSCSIFKIFITNNKFIPIFGTINNNCTRLMGFKP